MKNGIKYFIKNNYQIIIKKISSNMVFNYFRKHKYLYFLQNKFKIIKHIVVLLSNIF